MKKASLTSEPSDMPMIWLQRISALTDSNLITVMIVSLYGIRISEIVNIEYVNSFTV